MIVLRLQLASAAPKWPKKSVNASITACNDFNTLKFFKFFKTFHGSVGHADILWVTAQFVSASVFLRYRTIPANTHGISKMCGLEGNPAHQARKMEYQNVVHKRAWARSRDLRVAIEQISCSASLRCRGEVEKHHVINAIILLPTRTTAPIIN